MPVFTSAAIAWTVLAGVVGYGAYKVGQSVGVAQSATEADVRLAPAAEDTGKITSEEAQTAAKKRAFRSGVLFTSPVGLGEGTRTSSAKLR